MESQQWGAAEAPFPMMPTIDGSSASTYFGRSAPPQYLPGNAMLATPSRLAPHSKYYVEGVSSRDPLQFRQAVQSLQHYPRSFIHAWLLLAQSLNISIQSVQANHQPFPALSVDELSAIVMLKDLPHDQVLAMYDDNCLPGLADEDIDRCNHSAATTCRSSTCSSVLTKRSSSRPSSKSSFTSLGPLLDIQEKEKKASKRLRKSTASDLPEVPETEVPTPQSLEQACIYRCTRCERSFRSMQTWSRHEKEDHEDISFPCMPDGAIEITGNDRQCALCGHEPTEEHLKSHNIEQCTQLKHVFKRSYELKNHLETHGLPKKSRQSDVLVFRWQRVPDKRAWACGFCKQLYLSLPDYHKHIAVEHYERGEDSKWDYTKVILGLLSQPHIAGSWTRLLASRFRVQLLSCKWSKSRAECVQTRLELGQEQGNVLAEAALDCAIYDRSLLHEAFRHSERTSKESNATPLAGALRPPVPPKALPVRVPPHDRISPSRHIAQQMVSVQTPSSFDPFKTPSPPILDTTSGIYTNHFDDFDQVISNDVSSNAGYEAFNLVDTDMADCLGSPLQTTSANVEL